MARAGRTVLAQRMRGDDFPSAAADAALLQTVESPSGAGRRRAIRGPCEGCP